MPIGYGCLVHPRHAVPVPIEMHHIRPVARGGQGSRTVQVCANAHGLIHALLDEIEVRAAASPYATVHEVIRGLPKGMWAGYDGRVRVLAYRGWQAYGLGFLGHRYDAHHRFWHTDGTPKLADVPHFTDLNHAARWSRRWRRELERL